MKGRVIAHPKGGHVVLGPLDLERVAAEGDAVQLQRRRRVRGVAAWMRRVWGVQGWGEAAAGLTAKREAAQGVAALSSRCEKLHNPALIRPLHRGKTVLRSD